MITEDSIDRVHGHLILRGVANEPLRVRECHIAGSSTITLIVGDDFHTIVLPYSHTTIGGS